MMQITFPASINFASTTCSVSVGSCTLVGTSTSGYILTLLGFGTYTKGFATPYTITLSTLGTNPDSSRDAGAFTVKTFGLSSNDGNYYGIDSTVFTNVFTPDPGTLSSVVVSPTTSKTCSLSETYTIKVNPTMAIPTGG
jgi:hypothetical protein